MKAELYPSVLAGTVAAPGSKSIAQRMVACALLARGTTILRNFPDSADADASLLIAQALGAVVTREGTSVSIRGGFPSNFQSGIRSTRNEVACGESGLASRMFIPIAALSDQPIRFDGSGTLLQRPFDELGHVLPQGGVEMNTNNGRLPVIVRGPLQPGEFRMDGSLSSQYLTGMLLALPRLSGRSTVVAERLTSIPYVEMTIQVASLFGVSVRTADWKHFEVPGNQPYQAVDVAVPGDWSAAAFLLVAGALASDQGVLITNLDTAITQADARILHFLSEAGVRWEQRDNGIFVVRSHVQAFDADLTHCPDLFPPLVVLAAHANGVCTFKGARRLVSKESNRARVLQEEWAKANIRILVRDDEMKVYPGFARRAVIHSHQDHRIAMAAAVMGLAGERTSVVSAECVSKSFPSFFDALRSIRAKVILQ